MKSHTHVQAQHTLRRLLGYLRSHHRLLKQAAVLLIVATVADVLGPWLIKIFIDDYVMASNWESGPIATLALCYIGAQCVAAGLNYLQAMRWHRIALQVVQDIRDETFAKVIRLPLAFFDRTPTGSLITRLTNDTESIKDLYVNVLATFVQNAVRVVGIMVAMALLDTRLVWVCAVFLPVVIVLMMLYQRYSTPLFQRARRFFSDINTRLHEAIQGMTVVQMLNQEARFSARFSHTAQEHYRARLRNLRLDALLLRPFVDLMHTLTLALLLALFGYQAITSVVELGVIYAFVNYLGRFTEPIIEMTQRLSALQQAIVAGQRVFALLDEPEKSTPIAAAYRIARGDIAFDKVSFSYDGKQEVLNNVSFHVPAGSFCAIVGPTGSGKSTITNLLLRFYDAGAGAIRIDGRKLDLYSLDEVRTRIGSVQQEAFVLNDSIAGNITLGRVIDHDQVIGAARQAGLHDFVMSLPDGYNTVLGERGNNLSMGQRQQLSLARALAVPPRILILDEATSNIDSHTERVILNSLERLRGKVTLIVVAHRLSTIQSADQILVLHHGQLTEQGAHSELLKQGGIYHRLHLMQELRLQTGWLPADSTTGPIKM